MPFIGVDQGSLYPVYPIKSGSSDKKLDEQGLIQQLENQSWWGDFVKRVENTIGAGVKISNLASSLLTAAGDFISAFIPLNSNAVTNLNKYVLQVTKNLGAKIISNNSLLERIATAYQRGSSNLTSELASMISGDARNQSLRKRLKAMDEKYLAASKDITSANQKAQADIDRYNMAQSVASTGRVSGLKQADELITGQTGRGTVEQLISNLGSDIDYYNQEGTKGTISNSDPSLETQNLVKGGFGE